MYVKGDKETDVFHGVSVTAGCVNSFKMLPYQSVNSLVLAWKWPEEELDQVKIWLFF